MPQELVIPPAALDDPAAFEIFRLWAAGGQRSRPPGQGFGELLADLLEHAARLYFERDDRPLAECRLAMLGDLARRFSEPNPSVQGGIG